LACRGCDVFEVGTGALLFAGSCAVEAEVRGRASRDTAPRVVIFVVVDWESGTVGHTGALVLIK